MKKSFWLSQLEFPPIKHKTAVMAVLCAGVLLTVLSLVADLSLWIAVGGVSVYLFCLVYFTVESIRCKSYLIILSFIGMMAIGIYFLLILFGVVR